MMPLVEVVVAIAAAVVAASEGGVGAVAVDLVVGAADHSLVGGAVVVAVFDRQAHVVVVVEVVTRNTCYCQDLEISPFPHFSHYLCYHCQTSSMFL